MDSGVLVAATANRQADLDVYAPTPDDEAIIRVLQSAIEHGPTEVIEAIVGCKIRRHYDPKGRVASQDVYEQLEALAAERDRASVAKQWTEAELVEPINDAD